MDAQGITGPAPEQKGTTPSSATTCPKCGSETRVGRGLCLSCLLQQGIALDEKEVREPDTKEGETLDKVLTEVDVHPVSWRLGNYEILKEIGRGGMGVIYQARQRYSGRIVAVKRLLGYHADSRETLVRFRREAQAAASLDHPNILPIYEVSETEDGVPFFSMKLAVGGSLAGVADSFRHDSRRCVALVAKVTRAVQHAHANGILHRDLKPGNILLDEQGNPLVSDFGLAKWLNASSDITHTLTIFGTPGYIAPEQAGDSTTASSPVADIYSLGAILFDLLAGRPPFIGSHAISVIRQATEKEAPKLRSLCKLADRDLETICARCLEREPSRRYQTARGGSGRFGTLAGRPSDSGAPSFPADPGLALVATQSETRALVRCHRVARRCRAWGDDHEFPDDFHCSRNGIGPALGRDVAIRKLGRTFRHRGVGRLNQSRIRFLFGIGQRNSRHRCWRTGECD